MESSDRKSTPPLSTSPPQDKSPSTCGSFKVPRATTSFKTSNPEIFPSLNPLGGHPNTHKTGGDSHSLSPSEDYQDLPLKKVKSENSAPINMLANYESRLHFLPSAQESVKLNFTREGNSLLVSRESSKLTMSERENIKEYMENFYSKNSMNEEKMKEHSMISGTMLARAELDRKDNGVPSLFQSAMSQQKPKHQEMFKTIFSNLIHEFEVNWKRQLDGLYELEKWYNTEIPFNSPLSESINMLLVDRLSKKLKVEQEALDLVYKAQNVYEIHQEYKEKYKEYQQNKTATASNTINAKPEKKVIVLDGNYDGSGSRIGCKRSFQEMEGKTEQKEIKESA